MYKNLEEDITKAKEVKDISLYTCVEEKDNHFVKYILLKSMGNSGVDGIGEFEYILFPRPSVGDDILLRKVSKDDGYGIWKIIKIIDPCLGVNSGKLLLKYISSIDHIPGETD